MKNVTDPNVSFDKGTYTILPPRGEGWMYMEGGQNGSFDIVFAKRGTSSTHTFVAKTSKIYSSATFATRDEFFKFAKLSLNMDIDPRRFKMIEEKIELSDKFGPYSFFKYGVAEDNNAANANGSVLILKVYGYGFIHPSDKALMVDIMYSERGKSDEIDPAFENKAKAFIDGFSVKK